MNMQKLIIASTSTIYGSGYLEYLLPTLKNHFTNCKEIIFIPFARPSGITHNEYTAIVKKAFAKINIEVKGLHEFEDFNAAISEAGGIFTGGGNTFLLVKQLYDTGILETLQRTLEKGIPYLGTSAGSNICGVTMQNTNDMPIVYPPSFKTLALIPFNVNAHYLDPDPSTTHKGETRETRIKEYHKFNNTPVVGLREGSWLDVNGTTITLEGNLDARIFEANKTPYEVKPSFNLSTLK